MEHILTFIQNYGLSVFVIATCIIMFIGILKLCKVFSKISSKSVKKLIYYIADIALSFGGAAIYFTIFNKDFSGYVAFSATQVTATTTLYAIYENFGVRKLVQMLLNWVASWFKKNPEHKFTKLAKQLGLDAAIAKLQEVKTEEAAKEAAKTAAATITASTEVKQ
jgi:hypothetical protein